MALGLTVTAGGVLIRMRLAALRHALRDPNRVSWLSTGGVLGVALAGGTIWAATRGENDVVAVAIGFWMLGWVVGPLFSGGGDETLKPEYFTMLPLPPRALSGGLLAAAFAGVAPAVSLIALLSLVVVGGQLSVGAMVIAVPAALLQLLCFVLASRLAVALYGVLLQVRAGAVLAALVNAFILAFAAQGWALIAAFVTADVQGAMASAARIAPSGWGLAAVEATGQGDHLMAVANLGGLAVLAAVMFVAWSALLVRRTTATRTGVRPRRLLSASTAESAATDKELRSWTRDLMYGHRVVFAIAYGLFFCLMPLAVGSNGMLPWAGAAAVIMGGSMFSNLYGADGTAFWLTLMVPRSALRDIRARQRAFLLAFSPPVVLITVLLAWWAGTDTWPIVLSVVPALLGGAAGLIVLASVYAAVPTTDAHKRSGNPLSSGENESETTGVGYVMLLLVSLTATPALLVSLTAGWWGIPAGFASAVLAWWSFGRLAAARLDQRGPELLTLLRHGRNAGDRAGKTSLASKAELLPRWRRYLADFCLGCGVIPLVPQAIVPAVFKLTNNPGKAWFLALYAPSLWQWPIIVAMATIGLTMFTYGGYTYHRVRGTDRPRDTVASRG